MPQEIQSVPTHKRPVRCFIVGCPRSGTTLLTSIISGHPKLFGVLSESHYFSAQRARVRGQASSGHFEKFDSFRAALNNGALGAPGDPLPEPSAFISELDDIAARADMLGWVEKTPENLHHIEAILSVAPDARFIHVVRNAGTTLASGFARSIREQSCAWNPAYRSFRAAYNEWMRAMEATSRWHSHSHHLVVEYAQFVRAPDREIERITRFLGLEPADEMLSSAVPPEGDSNVQESQEIRSIIRPEQWDSFKRIFPGLRGVVVRLLSLGGSPRLWLRMPILSRGQHLLLRLRGGAVDRWLTPAGIDALTASERPVARGDCQTERDA